jgi:hypothetical protein
MINLGGKERRLRYDINAAAEMEELLNGRSLLYIMGNPMAAGFAAMRVLLWGGLKHAEKGLTLQRVGLMMQEHMEAGGKLEDFSNKIGEAIRQAKIFGDTSDEKNEKDDNEGNA